MLVALFASGVMYIVIGIFIKLSGTGWLMHLLPPVVVGPVIMVIGLSLAPTAVNMAMYENSRYEGLQFKLFISSISNFTSNYYCSRIL